LSACLRRPSMAGRCFSTLAAASEYPCREAYRSHCG
jgi:hypothetical protein